MPRPLGRLLAIATALVLLPSAVLAQEAATITGRVTNEAGAPLTGASVFLEGMDLGDITDEMGDYEITVPGARVQSQEATLTARVIGYQPESRSVLLRPGRSTHNFTLSINPLRLGEVVITGAGTVTTREKLGVTINSVRAEEIAKSNEMNVVQALAAKAPNVQITQQSGEPGASSYIRIRGIKSVQGTGQPLFVVDGIPIDNSTFSTGASTASAVAPNRASDINPADIESVEILKGAAAAAIYGARAAEGVVLITTKSGRPGRTRVSLQSTLSLDDVTQAVPLQTSFGQGLNGVAATCAGPGCRPTPVSWGAALGSGTTIYDHFDEVFEDGLAWDNVLTASGGNERTTFYTSLGWLNHDGIITGNNDDYERTTARLKATHQIFERLQLSGNFAYTDVNGSFVQKGSNISGLLLGSLRTPPEFNNFPYLDPDILATGNYYAAHRSYRYPRPTLASATAGRGYDNPLFIINEIENRSELGRVVGNVALDYQALDWLRFNYVLGADYYSDWRIEAFPLTSSNRPTGLVTRADINNLAIDHNLTATASWTATPEITGNVTVGQNLNSRRYRRNYVTGYDLIAPQPFALHNTITWDPSEFRYVIHTESYFAQATADLYDQLYLTAAIRNDGFSTFGASERRHWFPKVSAAWVFTNALGNVAQEGLLSFGKARIAYGQAGREPGVYQTITAFATGAASSGWGDFLNYTQAGYGGVVTGGTLGNDDLLPERTTEIEAGLDFGFLDQRTDLSLTYYRARSEDVILSLPIPPSTGYTTRIANGAEIENRGFEVVFNARPVTTENVAWDFGINWGTNETEVLDLEGAEFVFKSAGTFSGSYGAFTEGMGLVMRGEDFVRCGRGLSVGGIDIDNTAGHCQGAPAGALYIDGDGFPVYDPTDRVIADPTPDWTAGVRSSVTLYRNWQLSGQVDVRRGGQIWNGTKGALYYFGTHADTKIRGQTRTFGEGGWFDGPVAGPGVGTPVVIDQNTWFFNGIGSGFTGPASQFVEDGSFVKLRELSVSYTMTQPWVQSALGLSSVDIRLAGRNLATWTDYTGIDPETNLGGAEVAFQGADYFNNPQSRSFVLTIGLNR